MTKVLAFHLMPYMEMEKDYEKKYNTSWVTYPNRNYDPLKGHQYYNEYLDQLEYADQLGFDGIVVNEHHQTAYGNMPEPNIIAAMLARRIKGKIAILGNAIPLHAVPQRVAEELAMLDVVTGGNRIIAGFVRGTGPEYYSISNVNPNDSKERFLEAHDLIIKCWTEPGPFEFHGKHYHFPYLNIWPRPISKPFPKVYLPSSGSLDTVRFAARHKYTYMLTLASKDAMKAVFDVYREEADKLGYKVADEQIGWSHKIYVAETDAKAWEEYEEHIRFFYKYHSTIPNYMRFPPGYMGVRSKQMAELAMSKENARNKSLQELFDEGFITVGSPETVRQRLTELQKEMGFGVINAHVHTGNMPHWKAMKNIDLFGRYVLKHIQKLGDGIEVEQGDVLKGKDPEEIEEILNR